MSEERSMRWPIWIAIIFLCAVICSLYLPQLATSGRPSPKSNIIRKWQLEQIAVGCVYYFADYHSWPTNLQNLYKNGNARHLVFVNCQTNDAWGHSIMYESFDNARGFGLLKSLGRDGNPGGTGLDQDIEIRFNAKGVLR